MTADTVIKNGLSAPDLGIGIEGGEPNPDDSPGAANATDSTLQRSGRRLNEDYDSPPCKGCRRWSTNLCGLNICVSCKSGRFCSQIIPIETISVADMISSSALIYRPDILDNPNVPYFYK